MIVDLMPTDNVEKSMKKKEKTALFVSLAIGIIAIVLITIVILARSNSPERRLQAQLELGSRYLEEYLQDRIILTMKY